jgi:hypothetical protein
MTSQLDFFERVARADGRTYEPNEVVAHTGDAPPACVSVRRDVWLCPNCHPGGKWAKDKTGFGHIGGSNVFRCHYCGYVAVMRYTIQHAGHRRFVPEDVLAEQAKDPVAAWEETLRNSRVRARWG